MDEYLGVIRLFAGSFAPQGWMFCDGSLLSVFQNEALFNVIGITFGGDGKINFALPDLRGRVVVAVGTNPAVTPGSIFIGQTGGNATVALNSTNLPLHTHQANVTQPQATLNVSNGNATQNVPLANSSIASPGTTASGSFVGTLGFASGTTNTVPLQGNSLKVTAPLVRNMETGTGTAFSVMPPYLGMHYIICTQGQFPLLSPAETK